MDHMPMNSGDYAWAAADKNREEMARLREEVSDLRSNLERLAAFCRSLPDFTEMIAMHGGREPPPVGPVPIQSPEWMLLMVLTEKFGCCSGLQPMERDAALDRLRQVIANYRARIELAAAKRT